MKKGPHTAVQPTRMAAQALILHKALITHPSLQSEQAWAMKHKQSRHPHSRAGLRDAFPDLLGHILPHSSITAPWLKNTNQQSSSLVVACPFSNTELQNKLKVGSEWIERVAERAVWQVWFYQSKCSGCTRGDENSPLPAVCLLRTDSCSSWGRSVRGRHVLMLLQDLSPALPKMRSHFLIAITVFTFH